MKHTLLKRLIAIVAVMGLFVLNLGGCEPEDDQQNTAEQEYQNCINQKKAAGVNETKACELCGGKNCGGAAGSGDSTDGFT